MVNFLPKIVYAQELVEARHPLKKAHITQVWPFFKVFSCCLGKPKRSFKLGLKRSLRERLGIPMPKSEIKIEDDPFLRMGKFFVASN
jgi:hypothetical protein